MMAMAPHETPPIPDHPIRCDWAGADPLYIDYHDREWGVAVYDDRRLFEFLILEGLQAGLSWITILRKREAYRRALSQFDPLQIAQFEEAQIAMLLENAQLIRNRLKMRALVSNARKFLEIQARWGSFKNYIWRYVDGRPIVHYFESMAAVPAADPLSEQMAKDLKTQGFKFVGPTICYAYMQAVGMVNDHLVNCFRHAQIARRVSDDSITF